MRLFEIVPNEFLSEEWSLLSYKTLHVNLKLYYLRLFRLNVAHKKDLFGLCSVVYVYQFIKPGQLMMKHTHGMSHTARRQIMYEGNQPSGVSVTVYELVLDQDTAVLW